MGWVLRGHSFFYGVSNWKGSEEYYSSHAQFSDKCMTRECFMCEAYVVNEVSFVVEHIQFPCDSVPEISIMFGS